MIWIFFWLLELIFFSCWFRIRIPNADPGDKSKCGSMRIRIRNTGFHNNFVRIGREMRLAFREIKGASLTSLVSKQKSENVIVDKPRKQANM